MGSLFRRAMDEGATYTDHLTRPVPVAVPPAGCEIHLGRDQATGEVVISFPIAVDSISMTPAEAVTFAAKLQQLAAQGVKE